MNLEGLPFPNFVTNLTLLLFCFSKTYLYCFFFFLLMGSYFCPLLRLKSKCMKETHLLGRTGSLAGVLTVGQDVVRNAELGSGLTRF